LLDADPFLKAASAKLARRSAFDAGTGFLTKGIGYFFLKFTFMGTHSQTKAQGAYGIRF
jgi:hypothetical protein